MYQICFGSQVHYFRYLGKSHQLSVSNSTFYTYLRYPLSQTYQSQSSNIQVQALKSHLPATTSLKPSAKKRNPSKTCSKNSPWQSLKRQAANRFTEPDILNASASVLRQKKSSALYQILSCALCIWWSASLSYHHEDDVALPILRIFLTVRS